MIIVSGKKAKAIKSGVYFLVNEDFYPTFFFKILSSFFTQKLDFKLRKKPLTDFASFHRPLSLNKFYSKIFNS